MVYGFVGGVGGVGGFFGVEFTCIGGFGGVAVTAELDALPEALGAGVAVEGGAFTWSGAVGGDPVGVATGSGPGLGGELMWGGSGDCGGVEFT